MKISINNKLIEKIIRIIKLRKNRNDICKSNNNDANNIREDKLNINDESLDKIYKLNRKENKKKSTEKEKIINFKKDKESGKIIDDIEFKKKRMRSGAIIECNVENVNDIIVYRRNGAKLKSETIPKESKKRSKLSDEKNKLENKYTSKNVIKKLTIRKYITLLVGMIFLSFISIKLAISSYDKYNLEEYTLYGKINASSIASENADNISTKSNNENSLKEEIVSVSSSLEQKDTNVSTISNSNNKTKIISKSKNKNESESVKFSKPVDGKIQKMFSSDKVIYSKTLQMWKTHDGIDISANVGKVIKSVEKGVVLKVYSDSFYGTTIIIEHLQGYKSCYSNLDEEVLVKENQVVLKGQKIGKIGSSAIGEIKDDSHLHFCLVKGEEIIDPTYIFK